MVARLDGGKLEFMLSCSSGSGSSGKGGGSGESGSSLSSDYSGDGHDDFKDSNDFLAERLMEFSSTIPSKQAMHLGKFLLKHGVDGDLAGYVVDNFTEMDLSRVQRVAATSLLRKWFINHRFLKRGSERTSCPLIGDTVKTRIDCLIRAIPGLVSSKESYRIASRLLDLQSDVAVNSLEYDLELLSEHAYIIPALPDKVKAVFYSVLDRSVERNRGRRDVDIRWRYNHLGELLENLGGFTRARHVPAYDVLRKLSEVDTKNILNPLYSRIASFPPDTPDNVLAIMKDVVGLIPEGSCLSDRVVVEVNDFLERLSGSFEMHESFEVGTFFDLCKNIYAVEEVKGSVMPSCVEGLSDRHPTMGFDEFGYDDFSEPDEEGESVSIEAELEVEDDLIDGILADYEVRLSLLLSSTIARTEHEVLGSVMDECADLEERIRYIALEYLKLSNDVLEKHGLKQAKDFAERVSGFNNVGNGPAQVLQDMELYKKGVIEGLSLSEDEDDMLSKAVLRERKAKTERREVLRRYRSVVDDGPVACPPELKEHLRAEFGVEVDEIWDFRRNQFTLYFDRNAADSYDKLRRRKIDKGIIRRTAEELHELDLLEPNVLWYAGGCGFGKAEVAFYEELRRLGYGVHMDIVDRSKIMLSKAALLCARKDIDVDVFELDLEKLNMKDLEKDRQVIFGLWGGTAFNWVERYMTFKRYHTIFRKRDALTPEGNYRYPRFYGGAERKKDVLLVEGDLVKDTDHYRDALSQLFLANGLAGEYGLTPDVLTDEAGRLCHTVYFNRPDEGAADILSPLADYDGMQPPVNEMGELQCIYLITKDKGPFRKGQAILVIDSGTLHEDEFNWHMGSLDYDSYFIRGDRNNAVALCRVTDGLVPFRRK